MIGVVPIVVALGAIIVAPAWGRSAVVDQDASICKSHLMSGQQWSGTSMYDAPGYAPICSAIYRARSRGATTLPPENMPCREGLPCANR